MLIECCGLHLAPMFWHHFLPLACSPDIGSKKLIFSPNGLLLHLCTPGIYIFAPHPLPKLTENKCLTIITDADNDTKSGSPTDCLLGKPQQKTRKPYLGIAQIAIAPPPPHLNGTLGPACFLLGLPLGGSGNLTGYILL